MRPISHKSFLTLTLSLTLTIYFFAESVQQSHDLFYFVSDFIKYGVGHVAKSFG